jgi:hypothetical protein
MVLSVASWRGSRASLLAKGEGRACRRHHESQGEKRGLREAKARRWARGLCARSPLACGPWKRRIRSDTRGPLVGAM